MTRPADTQDGFLTLAEAADRLGLSRLKLREGIAKGVIAARRDNEGRWRVDLAALPSDLKQAVASVPADPAALMGALFDEIEELGSDLAQSQDMTARLTALAGTQADMIDRLTTLVESRTTERDRLSHIAGQALSAAEEAETRAAHLQSTADRALSLLDRAAGTLESVRDDMARISREAADKDSIIADHGQRLERLFALSEQALDKAGRDKPAPGLIARIFGTSR
jgi:excisionase family DNA binding protein